MINRTTGVVRSRNVVNFSSFVSTCVDFVGNPQGQNGLDILATERTGGILSGSRIVGTENQVFSNYPAENRSSNYAATLPSLPNLTVSQLLSRTGPLTPKVNLPLFLFELKDIPRMLKHAGDLLHGIATGPSGLSPFKEAAAANLAYQFGWKPLVEDILKILKVVELTERKQDELDKADTSKGIRRRLQIGEVEAFASHPGVVVSSISGTVFTRTIQVRSTAERWAVVRWRTKTGQGLRRRHDRLSSFRIAMGLNPGMIPITIWKALPWTWMIDWCVDISSLMLSHYNQIYYVPTAICVMTSTRHEWSWPGGTSGTGIGLTAFKGVTTRKQRGAFGTDGSNVPTIVVPYLDAYKLSILGSLTILRITGR